MPRISSILAILTPAEQGGYLPDCQMEALSGLAEHFSVIDPTRMNDEEFSNRLYSVNPEVLIGCWRMPALPHNLPGRLKYYCHLAGSVRKQVLPHHLTNGLIVTNWGDSISRTVAECAVFHILTCLRDATYWAIEMHRPGNAAWKHKGFNDARSLFHRRIGLHGFGNVARELVRLLAPWQVAFTAFAPGLSSTEAGKHGVTVAPTLEALFAENEILVELAPILPETEGIVTERLLRLLPKGAVFINVGRGKVVDEDALLKVIQEGRISAGLDVFREEPLAADSGLRATARASLSPHFAGPTSDRFVDAGTFGLRNLEAYSRREPLRAVITPEIYAIST